MISSNKSFRILWASESYPCFLLNFAPGRLLESSHFWSLKKIMILLLKFSFSEKATKICAICLMVSTFTCGLLRKAELYPHNFYCKIHKHIKSKFWFQLPGLPEYFLKPKKKNNFEIHPWLRPSMPFLQKRLLVLYRPFKVQCWISRFLLFWQLEKLLVGLTSGIIICFWFGYWFGNKNTLYYNRWMHDYQTPRYITK